jgi:putative hemolysin
MEIDGWLRIFAVILVISVILKAFFRACEYAVIEANEAKVKILAEKEEKYIKLQKLMESESWLKNSFAVGKTQLNMLIGFSVFFLAENFLGWGYDVKSFMMLFLISVGATIVLSGITEIVPRKLTKNSERFAAAVVLPVKIYTTLLYPFAILSYVIAAVVCRLFGGSAKAKNESVTEEDIRHLVDTGNETGVIEESQCEMINNIGILMTASQNITINLFKVAHNPVRTSPRLCLLKKIYGHG